MLNPVFESWLESALLADAIKLKGNPLANFARYCKPTWQGKTWNYVNPLQDVEADVLAVQAGFKSSEQVILENGGNLNKVYRELGREKKLQEKYGLTLKLDEIKLIKGLPTAPAPDKGLETGLQVDAPVDGTDGTNHTENGQE